MMRIGKEKEQAREKDRDRERKKRGNRKYGQAKLKHSRKGIWSCITAGVVVVIFIVLLLISYLNKGQSEAIVGSFGLFNIILTGFGIGMAGKGLKERDKNYLTCRIGMIINILILVALILIFIRGCM